MLAHDHTCPAAGEAAAPAPPAPAAPALGGRNFSAAAALRARLLGSCGASAPRPAPPPADGGGRGAAGGRERETVALPMVDAAGRAVRGSFGREAAGAGSKPGLPLEAVHGCFCCRCLCCRSLTMYALQIQWIIQQRSACHEQMLLNGVYRQAARSSMLCQSALCGDVTMHFGTPHPEAHDCCFVCTACATLWRSGRRAK